MLQNGFLLVRINVFLVSIGDLYAKVRLVA